MGVVAENNYIFYYQGFKTIVIVCSTVFTKSLVAENNLNFYFRGFWCPNLWTFVFVKRSPKRSYSVIENERFGLVFAKTGSIISGTGEEVPTAGGGPVLIFHVTIGLRRLRRRWLSW